MAVAIAVPSGYREAPARVRRVPARVRRRRLRSVVLLAITALGLWYMLSSHAGSATGAGVVGGASGGGPLAATGQPTVLNARPAVAHTWVVRPGDTLWGIVMASGYRGDPRPLVDKLSAQLGGRPLQPGERIVLP